MKEGRKQVSCIKSLGTAREKASSMYSLYGSCWVPKSDFIHLHRLMRHDWPLEIHVALEIERAWLNAICMACWVWGFYIVNVLDQITLTD